MLLRALLLALLVGLAFAAGWQARGRLGDIAENVNATASDESPADADSVEATLTPVQALRRTIEASFTTGDYDRAVTALADYMQTHPQTDRGVFGELFLFQAQRLDLLGAKATAVALLERYLGIAAADLDGWVLLAALHYRQGRSAQALRAMAQAAALASGAERERLLDEFDHLLNDYAQARRQTAVGNVDLVLLDEISRQLPQHEPLFLELARGYIGNRDFGAAAAALQSLNPNGAHALQRERLDFQINREIQQDAAFESAIDLQRLGSHFLVVATAIEDYDERELKLIIDTGASISLLTPVAAAALGLDQQESQRQQQLQTPGGQVVAPIYELDALAIGRDVIWSLPIAIVSLDTGGAADGLLGMDFLSKFEFAIDQKRQQLRLVRR